MKPAPTLEPIESRVEKLNTRMYHHRISQEDTHEGWNHVDMLFAKSRKPRDIIREHLEANHIVTTGWTASSVRGYHHYHIYWKERKK